MEKACVKMNGFPLYCEVFSLSCSFLNEFFYAITWINVARYLAVSLWGPVRTLRRGTSRETFIVPMGGWTVKKRVKYIKHFPHLYKIICKKKITAIFLRLQIF